VQIVIKQESVEFISGWDDGLGYGESVRSALISAVKK